MAHHTDALVQEIRQFNRFYTNIIGLLDRHVLNSPFSLAEARVLLEISQSSHCTASRLIEQLNLDPGYLSRIIKRFEREHLVYRERSNTDGRSNLVYLTEAGRRIMDGLETTSNRQIRGLIGELPASRQLELVQCMKTIQRILDIDRESTASEQSEPPEKVHLRHDLRPGDIGSIIHLHGVIYAAECGYNHEFEGYVCGTFQSFAASYRPGRDRLWVAETSGPGGLCGGPGAPGGLGNPGAPADLVGSVAIIGHTETTAQLRWLLIQPSYRGKRLGQRMLDEALQFCRERGYQQVFLLTTSDQQTAIHMYKKAGFVKTETKPVQIWGRSFTDERYELTLVPGVAS